MSVDLHAYCIRIIVLLLRHCIGPRDSYETVTINELLLTVFNFFINGIYRIKNNNKNIINNNKNIINNNVINIFNINI